MKFPPQHRNPVRIQNNKNTETVPKQYRKEEKKAKTN